MKRMILLVGILILDILLINYLYNNILLVKRFQSVIKEEKYLLTALGSINNDKNTNSIDALNLNYKNGHHIYEVDISLTSDDKLVLASGWNLTDYKTSIGINYYNDGKHNTKDTVTPKYDDFMKYKIQDKYTATSYKDLIDFMNNNKDTYFLFDIGNNNDATISKVLKLLKQQTPKKLYKRIIIHVYNDEMLKLVKKNSDFKLINILYIKRNYNSVEDFIEYCNKNNITSFSTVISNINKEDAKVFNESNLISIVNEVNDMNKVKMLDSMGIDLIGTDFLRNEKTTE